MAGFLRKASDNVFEFTVIAISLFIGLIIVGNLVDNSGFAANSQLANQTNNVLLNYTQGVVTFGTYFNIWFVLAAVAILVLIAFAVVRIVQSRDKGAEIA